MVHHFNSLILSKSSRPSSLVLTFITYVSINLVSGLAAGNRTREPSPIESYLKSPSIPSFNNTSNPPSARINTRDLPVVLCFKIFNSPTPLVTYGLSLLALSKSINLALLVYKVSSSSSPVPAFSCSAFNWATGVKLPATSSSSTRSRGLSAGFSSGLSALGALKSKAGLESEPKANAGLSGPKENAGLSVCGAKSKAGLSLDPKSDAGCSDFSSGLNENGLASVDPKSKAGLSDFPFDAGASGFLANESSDLPKENAGLSDFSSGLAPKEKAGLSSVLPKEKAGFSELPNEKAGLSGFASELPNEKAGLSPLVSVFPKEKAGFSGSASDLPVPNENAGLSDFVSVLPPNENAGLLFSWGFPNEKAGFSVSSAVPNENAGLGSDPESFSAGLPNENAGFSSGCGLSASGAGTGAAGAAAGLSNLNTLSVLGLLNWKEGPLISISESESESTGGFFLPNPNTLFIWGFLSKTNEGPWIFTSSSSDSESEATVTAAGAAAGAGAAWFAPEAICS